MVERLWQGREDSVYYDESSPNPEQGLRKKYAVGASSAPVGWTTVVDAKLKDDLATARGYFSIKWRRCAVKIPKDPKLLGPDDPKVTTTRGIQEIFSYYGALGMRVFAPVKKGDYSAWQLVTQVPFLGQTSRGICPSLVPTLCLCLLVLLLIVILRPKHAFSTCVAAPPKHNPI